MSEEFSTAVAEYEQDIGFRPGTLCAYDVRSDRIADPGDEGTRAARGVDVAALRAPWQHIAFVEKREPPGWRLCKALRAKNIDGVRAPSVQTAGFNLVLWRWNIDSAAQVAALDPLRDLPRDQSSREER